MIERSESRSGELTVEIGAWPLVRIQHIGEPSDDLVAAHLNEIEEVVLARKDAFGMIVNQSAASRPTPVQRAMIAEHQTRNAERYRLHCVAEAYITPDPALRGGMIAVFWRSAPDYPYIFVDTDSEAESWVRDHLAAVGW